MIKLKYRRLPRVMVVGLEVGRGCLYWCVHLFSQACVAYLFSSGWSLRLGCDAVVLTENGVLNVGRLIAMNRKSPYEVELGWVDLRPG